MVKNKNRVKGYFLKADIKHYFDTVSHEILLNILKKRIKDQKFIWIIKKILDNFNSKEKGIGMPLGNYTSQFFANIYLNELDYFVKHQLKAKYYLRYVDDFVILHKSKKRLEFFKREINSFLNEKLRIELHPDKSKIISLQKGIEFLGYRIFYKYKLLRKRNFRSFKRRYGEFIKMYNRGFLSKENIKERLNGWVGYSKWANTYKLRKRLWDEINDLK